MTKDETLCLALEALQNPWKAGPDGVADAIIAIKAALETKDNQMKTDEDDEFDRIAHEAEMKSGQPYHYDVYVSPSQRNQVLEEVAKEIQKMTAFGQDTLDSFSVYIRSMKS
jgi:hypothetical protein